MKKALKKLILFLVRKYIGVRKHELFRFSNQKSAEAVYYFTDDGLVKTWMDENHFISFNRTKSRVSLNFILSDECEIVRFDF